MKYLSLLFLLPGILWAAPPQSVVGFIIKVYDGDTATLISCEGNMHKIRLAKIDAPELKQDFGKESKLCLSNKILNQRVHVTIFEKDKYRRDVGEIFKDSKSVNTMLVDEGCAWVYEAYNQDDSLVSLQVKARLLRRGLWELPAPTPPWVWRNLQKSD